MKTVAILREFFFEDLERDMTAIGTMNELAKALSLPVSDVRRCFPNHSLIGLSKVDLTDAAIALEELCRKVADHRFNCLYIQAETDKRRERLGLD